MADPPLYKRGALYWTRIQGRRVSTGCKTRPAALLAARRLEREAADPLHVAAQETTLGDAVAAQLAAAQARGVARGTLEMYAQKGGHLVRIFGSSTLLAKVNASAVDAFIAQRRGEGASDHTLAKELGTLGQVFRGARRAGLCSVDPATVLPVRWASGYQPRRRWLSPEQLEQLCAALSPDRAAYVRAFVATGAREAELYRLRPEDVDQAAGVVRLRGTKTDASDDEVPILPMFRPLLEQALADAPGQGMALLFPEWPNSWRDLGVACQRAGLTRISAHDLRRTAGQWLRRAGIAPHLIGRFLRHKTSRMAELVYAPLDAKGLAGLIGSAGSQSPARRRAK